MNRDAEFLYEAGNLRLIDRQWRRYHNLGSANVAEHSYRMMWIALTLAAREGKGDQGKIVKMALAHDLSESRTGDVDYISRQYVERKEHQAFQDIFAGTSIGEDFLALMAEYEKRESVEARIVKDADTLDVQIELKEIAARGGQLLELWHQHREEIVFPKLYTESAKKLWREITDTGVHEWHMKGKNRVNGGDWKKK